MKKLFEKFWKHPSSPWLIFVLILCMGLSAIPVDSNGRTIHNKLICYAFYSAETTFSFYSGDSCIRSAGFYSAKTDLGVYLGNQSNPAYIKDATLYGNVVGGVTGNADTATKLATARLFTVTDNDATNSQAAASSFDGSAAYTVKLPATIKASLTGNVTGDCTGSSGSCTGNAATATLASTVTVADSTSATCSVGLFEAATGSLGCKTDGGLTYNASTGVLTATGFSGPLTGAVTGNASTATKLETARLFTVTDNDATNSQAAASSFDGSAAYTVKLPATIKATLTGNVTGNCSGTSDTVTNATQAAITTCANLTTIGTLGHDLNIAATKVYQINSQQMARYYGTGTYIFGDGGANLNHTGGSEGYYNVFVGGDSGRSATLTYYTTGVGYKSLDSLTTGHSNTGIGFSALRNINDDNENTAIGLNAGRYKGTGTDQLLTATQSTFLGASTRASTNGMTNETVIGYAAIGQGSNTIMLGNSSVDSTNGLYCYDTGIASPSDISLKKDIEPFTMGMDFLKKISPIEFRYKTDSDDSEKRQGFSAQEIQSALEGKKWNGLGKCNIDGEEKLAVAPSDLIPVLVNAIKEQQAQIDDLEKRLEKLEKK